MTTSNNIKGLVSAFDNAQNIIIQATKELLEGAFKEREEYKIPEVLWDAIDYNEGAPTSVWVDYRHDGANIGVYGVQKSKYDHACYVWGKELGEYACGTADGVATYDLQECAYFIKWYIENDWDNKINHLAEMLQGVETEEDAISVIEKYNEETDGYLLEIDGIDFESLIDWAKEFTPIAE